jgi:glycosyltransferase involved in cell wall biosynthesis
MSDGRRAPIIVNVRNLRVHGTGVQRYTEELVSRLRDDVEEVAPGRAVYGLAGHLWEQTALSVRLGGRLLWSPANTGPWWIRRQVVTIHDAGPLDAPEWYGNKFAHWYRFLLPRLLATAQRVITVSEFSRARLAAHVPAAEERIVAIPNGIGPEFRPVPDGEVARLHRRYRLPAEYVLAVSTLEPRKNLARLVEAWERVRARQPDALLAIAGGRFDDIFGGTGFGRLPRGVLLLGYVDAADVPALYAGARAFVHPSLYEGFGFTVLESMACGTPVVAARAGALPEVVAGAGVLVDPADVDSIEDGVVRVLEDEELRGRLRAAGFARAEGFSWERTAEATRAVLLEAVAETTTPGWRRAPPTTGSRA